MQETPGGHKKKIISVGSDFESSPSPEESPSPIMSPGKSHGLQYDHHYASGQKEREKNFAAENAIRKPAYKSQSFNSGNKSDEFDEEKHNLSDKLNNSGKRKKILGSNKW